MKKLLKHKWNKLHPCEKKAAIVAGVIGMVCITASIVLDIRDMENGGDN